MSERHYRYVIVGGGLAAASAVKGIREIDAKGTIALISSERHLPYDRPPLSKKLWFGKKKVSEIFIGGYDFYVENRVAVELCSTVTVLDPERKSLSDSEGRIYRYEKLLLATGGVPRRLDIPGGDDEGIFYFRSLDDYLRLRNDVTGGRSAAVIGGGFIGSEMAAALAENGMAVTMIFPGPYPCARVFPEPLGRAVRDLFEKKGVRVLTGTKTVSIAQSGGKFITKTDGRGEIISESLIAGVGITPRTELAKSAGLEVADGIVVDDFLQTSAAGIYAAGDNAEFPYAALGRRMRVEHWDNALNQGIHAGRNMAGACGAYTYMPYFFSDLFEFGYEAVGDVDARLETFADWQKENDTGVIYYLRDGKVAGVMLCNVWEKVERARELIREGEPMSRERLKGLIK